MTSALKYTTYNYNADDSVQYEIDPRGVRTDYKYGYTDEPATSEHRSLLTRIAYTVPSGSNIHDPADVQFAYDDAGNRISMSDDSGTLGYTYDELSRLKTETKHFSPAPSQQPTPGYVLSYGYHLSGDLKSITATTGPTTTHQFTYSADKTGRLTSIGNDFGSGIAAYANNIKYRAFGGIKSMSLSTTTPINVTLGYDEALRPETYRAQRGYEDIHNSQYMYNQDGLLKEIDNNSDPKFSHMNKYDFAGRLKVNNLGSSSVAGPFQQNMAYDSFSNLATRNTTTWDDDAQMNAQYENNRRASGSGANPYYDNAGNVISSGFGSSHVINTTFDAVGGSRRWEETFGSGTKGEEMTFDGDGRVAKRVELDLPSGQPEGRTPWYYLYSSVTGQKIVDLDVEGTLAWFHVYYSGTEIAEGSSANLEFHVVDPITGSVWKTNQAGEKLPENVEGNRIEIAGLQTSVPVTTPSPGYQNYGYGGFPGSPEHGCVDQWHNPTSCNQATYNYSTKKTEPKKPKLPDKGPTKPKEPSKGPVRVFGGDIYSRQLGLSQDPAEQPEKDCPKDENGRYYPECKVPIEFDDDVEASSMPDGNTTTLDRKAAILKAAIKKATETCLIVIASLLPKYPATVDAIRDNNRSQQPLNLLLSHAAVESTFGTYLDGRDKEEGLFQTGPATVKDNQKRLNLETYTTGPKGTLRNDFALNTRIATTILQDRIDKTGSVINGLMAYKAGLGGAPPLGKPTFNSIVYANSIVNCSDKILYPRQ